MENILTYILFPFLGSLFISWILIPRIIRFAKSWSLYSIASGRDSHEGSMPIFGGIAIFFAIVILLCFYLRFENLHFILLSLVIVFLVGLIDDLLSIPPFRINCIWGKSCLIFLTNS